MGIRGRSRNGVRQAGGDPGWRRSIQIQSAWWVKPWPRPSPVATATAWAGVASVQLRGSPVLRCLCARVGSEASGRCRGRFAVQRARRSQQHSDTAGDGAGETGLTVLGEARASERKWTGQHPLGPVQTSECLKPLLRSSWPRPRPGLP